MGREAGQVRSDRYQSEFLLGSYPAGWEIEASKWDGQESSQDVQDWEQGSLFKTAAENRVVDGSVLFRLHQIALTMLLGLISKCKWTCIK